MKKKLLLLVVAILMGGMTTVMAKINYVPLYIVDTQTDVNVTRKARNTTSVPQFITQDDHRLTLPELEDNLAFMVFKDNECVYEQACQPTVDLPATLVGDYEVRLVADTYYYHGYMTLDGPGIPSENDNWENITLLGSNSSQQAILDNIMTLNVVEYNMKTPSQMAEGDLEHLDMLNLSELEKEEYIKYWEGMQAEKRAQLRIGLLAEELKATFPQVVIKLQDGTDGINYLDLVPVLVSCIQELKVQLDSRTETIVDVMMSRSNYTTTDYSAVRSAIGNTILSAAPSSVSEPAQVRYVLTDNVTDAYIAVTDMGGRELTKVPVSPTSTSISIGSSTLGEGIFLCSLFANGEHVGTKRLVKTK
jgi:hypothetical protein